MKKLRLVLLGLLVVGIAFWLAWKLSVPTDPQYQGRRLSAMLKESSKDAYTLESGQQVHFAAEDVKAIRHMGTNAIPYLLREISATDSAFKLKIQALVSQQPVARIRVFNILKQDRAAVAFRVLGPVGEPAIPELVKLLNKGEKSSLAGIALGGIGDKSLPFLIQALSHSNLSVRASAAYALGATPALGSVVVPNLIHSLGDSERSVRTKAASSLGKIHQEPALAVPALIKCLEDSDHGVRSVAARALEKFGAEAKPAIPALLKAHETSESYFRSTIERALKAIDPEAAARAGIK